ncbi:protein FAM8A1 [Spea bombifrons]|uniref:protein FAM8A1 n=1 Tax=Spea bombifrons TaxID=233779 RepID=UPI0023499619|nr:protein FAM8A1 [Spea bombifrons]
MAEASESSGGVRERKTCSSEKATRGADTTGVNPSISAAEYTRRLQEWLWQCYCGSICWQSSCATAAALVMMNTASGSTEDPARTGSGGGAGRGTSPATTNTTQAGTATTAPAASAAGREYVIPTLAQRFRAEMVDFFILFFIKAAVILTIMHFSGIKDISKFAMHYIIEEVDEDTSMEDLQKMMVVALLYRLLVCFYEIICIWGAGGATPGKFLLGLRVVTCDSSVLIAPNRVLVIPSTNVNMTASTIRAVIKNFSIAFFFPAFITLLFFQHNRTAYDIVAGTIVVRRNTR